jgi:hypothetical protein
MRFLGIPNLPAFINIGVNSRKSMYMHGSANLQPGVGNTQDNFFSTVCGMKQYNKLL